MREQNNSEASRAQAEAPRPPRRYIFHGAYKFIPVIQRWKPGLKLGGSVLNLHDVLCYLAFHFSTVRFENLPSSLFADLRGMSPEAVQQGRDEAVALGWIGCARGYRGTYCYWFLDATGKEFTPGPEAKPRAFWRFEQHKWQLHLARRRNPPPTAEDHANVTHRDKRQVDERFTANSSGSQADPPQTAAGQPREVPEKPPFENKCLPLESSSSEEDKTSGDVASDSHSAGLFGSPDETSSIPSWHEIGSGATREKRTQHELLEHVAADPLVQRLAEKFGATIVDVIDLRAGETLKQPGMAPADSWQTKIFGKPAKAAPIMHEKFSQWNSKGEMKNGK